MNSWLALVVSLPTQNSAGRMRVWRAVKALGCGVLRDGVYLLPNNAGFREALELQADDVTSGGGSAHVLTLSSEHATQQKTFEALFDRSAEYTKLLETIQHTIPSSSLTEESSKIQKMVVRLRKEFTTLVSIDFFPNPAQKQILTALEDLENSIHEHFFPGEPRPVQQRIRRLQLSHYQNRIWATRQKPWIDRLASAWLIHRFIDADARFIWLAKPDDCPDDALGFDFDGAEFTHIGSKVTFEVLLASFDLTKDSALNRIADVVHYLDVGGIPVNEAVGLETLMRGMSQCWPDDEQLFAEVEKIFDAYYQAFLGHNHEQ